MKQHKESPEQSNPFREQILAEFEQLIEQRRREAHVRRRRFFRPDYSSVAAYAAGMEAYRSQLKAMLGWPLTERRPETVPLAREEKVATDAYGRIIRIWIETLPGFHNYGLLFLPKGRGPFPLVIAQHGGGGTPELCSGFFKNSNYNDMTRRILKRGCAVFAPQLLMWQGEYGPANKRAQTDLRLKQLGGSIAAVEIHGIQRCIDYLVQRRSIDGQRVGMIGLSYGGFYTLFTAAVETRIRVALSSCFFNDRLVYDYADWVWSDAANTFLDVEVASLVCPRPLYVEVGAQDALFAAQLAKPQAAKVKRVYTRLGLGKRFVFNAHPGGHELDRRDDGIRFLCRHLNSPISLKTSGGGATGKRAGTNRQKRSAR